MRALATLRVLLPSWRFFDDIAGSPVLMARFGASSQALGSWRALARRAPRGPGSLFVNARGNLALAHHALLEHLLSDVAALAEHLETSVAAHPETSAAVEQLVSYRLVTRLVVAQLPTEAAHFQFKLTVFPDVADAEQRAEDLLISALHARTAPAHAALRAAPAREVTTRGDET